MKKNEGPPESFKDLFSQQSAEYQKYRPTYPQALFSHLASITKEHELAVDCGTGNGQAAVELVAFFDQVIATDPSAGQINKAIPHERIRYAVATAEKIPAPDHSVDLITVAQAFHWFKHAEFFQEVKRVLKPQGFLAIWVYGLCKISPAVDQVFMDFYEGLLGPSWEPERKLLEQNFETIKFPFVEIPCPAFKIEREWTVDNLMGYLSTWSALQTYRKNSGQDPLPEFRERFAKVWGEKAVQTVVWQIEPRIFSASLK